MQNPIVLMAHLLYNSQCIALRTLCFCIQSNISQFNRCRLYETLKSIHFPPETMNSAFFLSQQKQPTTNKTQIKCSDFSVIFCGSSHCCCLHFGLFFNLPGISFRSCAVVVSSWPLFLLYLDREFQNSTVNTEWEKLRILSFRLIVDRLFYVYHFRVGKRNNRIIDIFRIEPVRDQNPKRTKLNWRLL